MLSDEQIARYSRQIILPQVGGKGQQALLSAAGAVVGTGEMAATAALYLAAAGVGALTLAGAAETAPGDLEALNPDCHVVLSAAPAEATTADALVRGHDVIVAADAAADLVSRLNVACVAQRKPLVWGGVDGSTGCMAVLVGAPEAACYGCLQRRGRVPVLPYESGRSGSAVLGSVAAFIGTLQATAAIEQILGLRSATVARLLTYEALAATVCETRLDKEPDCPICGTASAGTGSRP